MMKMTTQNILKVKELWSNAAMMWRSMDGIDRALWLLGSEGKPKNARYLIFLMT
jgi:hypothetical protein